MPIPNDYQPEPAAPPPFPDRGLAIVPTLEGFQHLSERVARLEQADTATVPDEGAGGDQPAAGDLHQLPARVDRHRVELEAVKRTLNAVIEFLGAPVRPLQPAPTTKDYL